VNEDIRDAGWIRLVPIFLERVEIVEIGHVALEFDGVVARLIREKTNSPESHLGSERAGMFLEVEFGFSHARMRGGPM